MSRRGAQVLLTLLLAGLATLFALAPGRGFWILDPDAAAYVGLARSLAHGDGYVLGGEPHVKFPPGFPAYLSLAIRATGDDEAYGAMRDLVSLAGLVSVLLAYFAGRRLLGLSYGAALALAAALGSSIYLLQYSVAFLRSEPLFTALLLGSLLAGQAWRSRGGAGRAALAGALAGLATLVRSAGVAASGALLLARIVRLRPLGLRLDRRAAFELAVFGVLACLPPGAFAWRNAHLSAGDGAADYASEFWQSYPLDLTKDVDVEIEPIDAAGFGRRVLRNVEVLALSLGKFAVNHNKGANLAVSPHDERLRPGGVVLLLLLALGVARLWRRDHAVAGLALPLSVALYLVWPFNQQERFYLPVQPFLLAALALGAEPVARFGWRCLRPPAAKAAAGVLLFGAAAALARERSREAVVLGRWSLEYAALLFGSGLAGVVLLALAWRSRRSADGTAAAFPARIARVAVLGWLALSFASCAMFVRGMRAEHESFLAERAAHPVAERFARLKTHPGLIELFQRLLDENRDDALVMSDIPKMIHVATGLRTTPLRVASRRREVLLEAPSGEPVRFVYCSREIPWIGAIVDENRSRFEVLHEIRYQEADEHSSVYLFRVREGAGG